MMLHQLKIQLKIEPFGIDVLFQLVDKGRMRGVFVVSVVQDSQAASLHHFRRINNGKL